MDTEKGIFFCGNCGNTLNVTVTYEEKPKESCTKCGFDDSWIFEPIDEI